MILLKQRIMKDYLEYDEIIHEIDEQKVVNNKENYNNVNQYRLLKDKRANKYHKYINELKKKNYKKKKVFTRFRIIRKNRI